MRTLTLEVIRGLAPAVGAKPPEATPEEIATILLSKLDELDTNPVHLVEAFRTLPQVLTDTIAPADTVKGCVFVGNLTLGELTVSKYLREWSFEPVYKFKVQEPKRGEPRNITPSQFLKLLKYKLGLIEYAILRLGEAK